MNSKLSFLLNLLPIEELALKYFNRVAEIPRPKLSNQILIFMHYNLKLFFCQHPY